MNAVCKFCDTDFRGTDGPNGGLYDAEALVKMIVSLFPQTSNVFVVFTGGEPALQLDEILVEELHKQKIEIAVETNGTLPLPDGIDWICVSPKANTNLVITRGNELKLVYPQLENSPDQFVNLDFDNFYLQPLDDVNQHLHRKECVDYCLQHPQWKLSLQTHKILGIE